MKILRNSFMAALVISGVSGVATADGTLPFEDGTLPFGDGTLPFEMAGQVVEVIDGIPINQDFLQVGFAEPEVGDEIEPGIGDGSIPPGLGDEPLPTPVPPVDGLDATPINSLTSFASLPEELEDGSLLCSEGMDYYEAHGTIRLETIGDFKIDGVCSDRLLLGVRQVVSSSPLGQLLLDGTLSTDELGNLSWSGTASVFAVGSLARSFEFSVTK